MYQSETEKKYTARSEYSKRSVCPYYQYHSTRYTVGGRANRSNFIACTLEKDKLSLKVCFQSHEDMVDKRKSACEDLIGYTECPVFKMLCAEQTKISRRNNEKS